jgi:hypothetical protein
MHQIRSYGDDRQLARCAFCGGETGTVDHCPSRVLLDEPYPEQLPVVPACSKCNQGFSQDEQYLACLLSCVLAGSTDPEKIQRPKIRRILEKTPKLRARIENARNASGDGVIFNVEYDRVATVVVKLAKGHALYELHEPCTQPPDEVAVRPLVLMSPNEREEFENPTQSQGWPEVGSRAMQRIIISDGEPETPWLEVQRGVYRFCAMMEDGIVIRIVMNEYLACLVRWA